MKKIQYLQAMAVEVWQAKNSPRQPDSTGSHALDSYSWPELAQAVTNCTLCPLHQTRTKPVFGIGNQQAKIMLIGEAPGANEDEQGEPFVGKAGLLLTAMLQSIGLSREEVYIANILKCRPPANRNPTPAETKLCTPYLTQQIALVNPQILVAVGLVAAQFLLATDHTMSSLRNKIHTYGIAKTPLLVTYHPAYLLRSPSMKRQAYLDFLAIKHKLT